MFGGAHSGEYKMELSHSTLGALKTYNPDIVLTVGSNITSISPKVFSSYGGTIVTISGTNFGNTSTDNPVSLVFTGGEKSASCFVLTTNSTTITCQIDNTITKAAGLAGELVVFLKTSEEAKCTTDCNITFANNSGVIDSATVVYNNVSNAYEVQIKGSSFPTTGSDPVLKFASLA